MPVERAADALRRKLGGTEQGRRAREARARRGSAASPRACVARLEQARATLEREREVERAPCGKSPRTSVARWTRSDGPAPERGPRTGARTSGAPIGAGGGPGAARAGRRQSSRPSSGERSRGAALDAELAAQRATAAEMAATTRQVLSRAGRRPARTRGTHRREIDAPGGGDGARASMCRARRTLQHRARLAAAEAATARQGAGGGAGRRATADRRSAGRRRCACDRARCRSSRSRAQLGGWRRRAPTKPPRSATSWCSCSRRPRVDPGHERRGRRAAGRD